jgi:hypothetical protein
VKIMRPGFARLSLPVDVISNRKPTWCPVGQVLGIYVAVIILQGARCEGNPIFQISNAIFGARRPYLLARTNRGNWLYRFFVLCFAQAVVRSRAFTGF